MFVTKKTVLTVLLVAIGLIYLAASALKLLSIPSMVTNLAEMNFEGRWRYFIGITELIGVAGLMVYRLRPLALVALWPYAAGGFALHLAFDHDPSRMAPAIAAFILIPIALAIDLSIRIHKHPTP